MFSPKAQLLTKDDDGNACFSSLLYFYTWLDMLFISKMLNSKIQYLKILPAGLMNSQSDHQK